MVVVFYETTKTGSKEIGKVSLINNEVKGNVKLVNMLLGNVDRTDVRAVIRAMGTAPKRFDGSYLRAELRR